MTVERTGAARPKVLIVDDDGIAAGLLEHALQPEFTTRHVRSGEECLASVERVQPDVVLMDIGMDGMDGYECCRRLRGTDAWATPAARPAVVFVSARDTLEERLQAYDSGGDDFIAKPLALSEVQRKVQAVVALVDERKRLAAETASMQSIAMGFLTSLGESGTALRFLREGPECADFPALARLTLQAVAEFGLDAAIQLRSPESVLSLTPRGPASPLEESVLAQTRDLERIFQFRRRMVINYPHVSLLVNDLPVHDEERCGRLRDHLAVIAQGCEANVMAQLRAVEVERRRTQLEQSAEASRAAIETLRRQYREQQLQTGAILQQLAEHFTKHLLHMGLSEAQEDQLQALLSDSIQDALGLFKGGLDFDAQMEVLLKSFGPR